MMRIAQTTEAEGATTASTSSKLAASNRTSHKIIGNIKDSPPGGDTGLWCNAGEEVEEPQAAAHQQQQGSDHLEDPATDSDISYYSIGPADNMLTSKKKVSLLYYC